MHRWPLGTVIAFVMGLVAAFALLVFAGIRSSKKTGS
jgi:hypothetical protein